jgi:hypothetical protein
MHGLNLIDDRQVIAQGLDPLDDRADPGGGSFNRLGIGHGLLLLGFGFHEFTFPITSGKPISEYSGTLINTDCLPTPTNS